MIRRALAILLSALMVFSIVPTAFAEETKTNSDSETSVAEEVVEEEPTPEPTTEPTVEPTIEPTAEPTAEPTITPTVEPTVEPTAEPTEEPTPTPEPTEKPKESEVVASGTCGADLTWTLDSEGLLTISGTGEMLNYGYGGASWYSKRNSIKNVIIENGVTSIGSSAFDGCSSLTSITIPEGVTSIGSEAFEDCVSLISVTIPKGVTSIESNTFHGCSSLTSITIPEGVTSIRSYAFVFCSGLTNVTIPEGVTSIGKYAFEYCNSLTELTISCGSINNLGNDCFYGAAIKDINFHGTKAEWTNISWYHVASDQDKPTVHYESHKNHVIHSGTCGADLTWTLDTEGLLTINGSGAIDSFAFDSDYNYEISENIVNVIIENGVTSIGGSAFDGCSSLTSVRIPNSVISIDSYAFHYCDKLTSITIPNSVISIGDGAFYECKKLTSVIIPSSVKSIGDYAFEYCSSLTSITLSDGLTSIGDFAFYECKKLTSVIIPNSVKSIGDYAFEYCSSLTSVTIPDGVTSMGDEAFYGCAKLKTINYNGTLEVPTYISGTCGKKAKWKFDNSGTLTICGSGKMTNYDFEDIPWYDYNDSIESVIIEDGVTSICSDAFYKCRKLTSVIIPDSVISIGSYAFEGCTGLKTVTVGEGVASGEVKLYNVFEDSSKGFKLIISDGVFKIGNNAFEGCYFITSITLPDSVKTIGDSAFGGCSNLTSVNIPESVKTIGNYAFQSCGWNSGGINLTIPDSVTKIGDYAFGGCNLTSLLLPTKLPKISESAFGYYGGYYPTTIYYKGSGKQWETVKKSLPYYSDTYWSNGTYKKRSIICNVTHIHEYSTTKVTKATLSSNGKKYWKCKYCSKTKTSTVYKVASVKISDTTYLYNGGCKTPGVTVIDTNGTTLKKNTDYTVTHASGRREIGAYKVIVEFKGDYSGNKEFTFKIVPKGTSLSSVSASSKAFTAKWNLQKTQTTGYQIEYSTSSKFSSGNKYKTITKNTSSSLKVTGLKAKTKYYVRVRTYKTVNGTKVCSSWSSTKTVTTK